MFDYIQGKVGSVSPQSVVLDVGGIGYLLSVPVRSTESMKVGEILKLYVVSLFREPDLSLYGFNSKEDRELFLSLKTVSGVGPKLALALIGHLTQEDFQKIVLDEDATRLTFVPGVGKRTGERLLVELKSLSKRWTFKNAPGNLALKAPKWEALQALISLGYSQKQAEKALETVLKKEEAANFSTSALVTHVLKSKIS